MPVRKQIRVSGIVQGVGFRPFVHRLATERHLSGSVCNNSAGVVIEIQGPAAAIDDFVQSLIASPPPLAHITTVEVGDRPCAPGTDFAILPSPGPAAMRTLIAPDAATCPDCLRELLAPANRRYLYPFINCTHCGPRLTIVEGVPYDRARTTMAPFTMCPACQAEYDDPTDRRFHAQPNACWDCGPRLRLLDRTGVPRPAARPDRSAALLTTIDVLRDGAIVAVKGLGGFHLAVDAANPDAVARLRTRKRRGDKPFAVMVADLAAAETLAALDDTARAALTNRQRPIVLIPRRSSNNLPDSVAPRQCDFGLFLPYTPLHHLLFALGGFSALIMTSANLSDEPIAIDNDEAVRRLAGIADVFLVHDRRILLRCDDSVVRPIAGVARLLRRSRGYVPEPVELPFPVPPMLAVGGELKNTFCLARGREAFLGPHIGDLETPEAGAFFGESLAHFARLLEIDPELIACDLHPDYVSTRWALSQQAVKVIPVQHHHAHIAACMAENALDGLVIGLALDGTGYGLDHAVWGGEALLASYDTFQRLGSLEPVPMPGGSAAVREPWRMAFSYLVAAFGPAALDLDIPLMRNRPRRDLETLLRSLDRSLNAPLTSSCGRLFDAVAALLGFSGRMTYEAQAAMELESLAAAAPATAGAYAMPVAAADGRLQIPTAPLFEAILADLRLALPPPLVASRFHHGLAHAWVELAAHIRSATGVNRICLSGGAGNNARLLAALMQGLNDRGFEAFTHHLVPAGDGGLCLGQAVVAAAIMAARAPTQGGAAA